MSSNKKTKSKFNFIIICIIGFVVSIFFEFYFINYFPYDYFMLFGTGIIMCIFGYLSIDGVLEIINQTSRKRDEQNEIMIKASKAIYLTTKKIALNSHSMSDTLETPKDFGSLIDDLSQANERLAKEVENAVSLQSLVQKNRTIVNNAREIIEHHEQPLSPLEVEKDLKLDEAISETDFETVTQPEMIDSMIKQEVDSQEIATQQISGMTIQKENNIETPITADILEETIETVGNIMKEVEETPKSVSDVSNLDTSEETSDVIASQTMLNSQIEPETASDIFSEVKEAANHILNNSVESNISEENNNSIIEQSNTISESNIPTEDNNLEKSNITEHNIVTEAHTLTFSETKDIVEDATRNDATRNDATRNDATTNDATRNDATTNDAEMNYNITGTNTITETNIVTQNNEISESNIIRKEDNLSENIITSPKTETTDGNITAINNKTTIESKTPASESNIADKPMTSEEIAALFANL